MDINIVARPDHAHKLFEQLISIKEADDKVALYTFYCLSNRSLASKLFPKLRRAPVGAHTLDLYTLAARLSMLFLKRLKLNHRKFEANLFESIAPWKEIKECDVLHYWPFYCAKKVKALKEKFDLVTVAEYYEAEPSFVNAIYLTEYEKYGLNTTRFGNLLIDQNFALQYEKNAIVASEFTARSYRHKYPNVNFHVCSYGPAGFKLAESRRVISKMPACPRILYVGQVSLEKGVPYLIQATSKLNVSLDLVGPIKENQKEIFSGLLSSHKKCNHLGSKRNSEVLDLISAYDIFCLPSLADNYSLAVVEALSRGLPVVVTENCGNADDIIKFGLGCVANVCDTDSIVEAIKNLQNTFNSEHFNDGLERFFSNENLELYPRSVFDVYKKIVQQKVEGTLHE